MSETDPKKQKFVIVSLSQSEIEAYFDIKYCGTKKLTKLKRVLKGLKPTDFGKLAKAVGDDFKTEYYWDSLEYNFELLFIHNGV